MANYEATKYNFNGSDLTGIQGVNTGIIVPWSSGSVPTGFLECNGANVSRSTYSDLFAVVGTTYGAGDGSSTFGLPDLQNKVSIGKSNNKALASTGGADTVSATGNVTATTANTALTTNQIASHTHPLYNHGPNPQGNAAVPSLQYNANPGSVVSPINSGNGASHTHNTSANFSGDATSVLQPYLTTLYIIKT